jgi:hypothetical protein
MDGKYTLTIVGVLLVVAVSGLVQVSFDEDSTGLMTATGQARCKAPYPHTYEKAAVKDLPDWYNYCVYATGWNGDIMNRWMCCNEKLGKERRPPHPRIKPMTGLGHYY